MKVQIGDIVQIDGGLVIVKEVESVRAFCLPLPGFKNQKADVLKHGFGVEQASRNVIERRGQAGLEAFLAEQKQEKKAKANSMVKLELGDALCYHGERCTVIAVVEDGALLSDAAGNEYEEAREVNEFLFADCSCKGHVAGRLDAAGRAENLKQHLVARAAASQAAAANGPAATVNNNTETKKEPVMKKAVKAVKTEKQPKQEKPKRAAEQIKEGHATTRANQLFGSSICRVAMTAGAAGVTCKQFMKVLKKYNLTLAEGTINQNLRIGRAGTMVGAQLSKDQMAEFKA